MQILQEQISVHVSNAGAIAENTEFLIYLINRIIFSVSSATAPCVALPPASVQSSVFSVVNNFLGLIEYNTFTASYPSRTFLRFDPAQNVENDTRCVPYRTDCATSGNK
jgi:hypothetical protein